MTPHVVVMSAVVLWLLLAFAVCAWVSSKVLLVSMDGFRWDYLHHVSGLNNFTRLARQGVRVDYVNPVFSTKTYPGHYTIVTGLYEESHGIVANNMYDPLRNAAFHKTRSKESFWYGGEPVWVSAVKQDKTAGVLYWPGGDVEIAGQWPTQWRENDDSVPFPYRVDTALSWLADQHMDFVALYFNEPDSTGHYHGPQSQEVADKVREMDGVLGLILDGLDVRNLSDVVNVIVTSDHGMEAIDMQTKLIDLWDVLNVSMVERVVDSGTITAIWPAIGQEEEVVKALRTQNHMTVYRKEEIPEHFHYKHNPRIMPIIVQTEPGWELSVATVFVAGFTRPWVRPTCHHPYSHLVTSAGDMAVQGVSGRTVISGEPPQTDLDYYSRPENYEGSSLNSLQKFIVARDKQSKATQQNKKEKKRRKEEDELYRRYRHILAFDESLQPEDSSEEDTDSGEGHSRPRSRTDLRQLNGSASRRASNVGRQSAVSLAVSEAHRPLSEGHHLPDPLPSERRSASARTDVLATHSVSPGISRGGSPTLGDGAFSPASPRDGSREEDASGFNPSLPDIRTATPTHQDVRGSTPTPSDKRPVSPGGVLGLRPNSSRWETPGGAENGSVGSGSGRLVTRALVKNRFAVLSADTRRRQVRRKFAQAINAVMSIRKLASAMIKKSEEPSAMLKTFTDIIDMDNFSENLKNQGLSFDPSYFKANKEISISSEVKNILRLPPSSRTQEQIQTAMYGLQSLPSFAEYPLHMQEKLTKVAWYQVVPPKRTIIRQGHYAENFYFILSGQAVVTILIRDPKTGESHVRTANFMRKGTSFGELALLHHSRRTATVTSHDTVQLLSIGRDDFFDIFMARQGQDEIPEHIKFISQLDFMKGWPIERLLERPEHCLLHFFKRNMVIVKDSEQSEWLYIVKSGSCQVLKQLRGVTAKLGIPKHEVTLDESFHLPHTGTAVRGPKVDTGMWRPRPRSHRSVPEPLEELTEETEDGFKQSVANGSASVTSRPPPPESGTNKHGRRFSKKHFAGTAPTGKAHFRAPPPSDRRNRLVGPRRQRPSTLTPESSPRSDTSRPPAPPVFVQVSRLKPRDVFGLEMVKFHADLDALHTSVSLVSRGAECIMLSKDFFRKHATDTVKKNLQEIVRPYPDEVTFQESLQRKADWELFKHTLIEDLTSPPVV